jgi:hypothetical protein
LRWSSSLASLVIEMHHSDKTNKVDITATMGSLCHLPSELTIDRNIKAAKNEVHLFPVTKKAMTAEHELYL